MHGFGGITHIVHYSIPFFSEIANVDLYTFSLKNHDFIYDFLCMIFRIFSGKIAKDTVLIFVKIPQNWRLRRCLQVQLPKNPAPSAPKTDIRFFIYVFQCMKKNVYFPEKRQHTDIRFFHT